MFGNKYARATSLLVILFLMTCAVTGVESAPRDLPPYREIKADPGASALQQAVRIGSIRNHGVYSVIQTANPTLRNDPTGKWSYMRAGGRRIINGETFFIEVGWLKGSQPESNGVPRVYWVYRDINCHEPNCHPVFVWGAYPNMNTNYNYLVKKTGAGSWSVFFNDMNTPIGVAATGWNRLDDASSGGETPNLNQGMGPSDNIGVAYRSTNDGNWWALCNTTDLITNAQYHIDSGTKCNSWRVYGGN